MADAVPIKVRIGLKPGPNGGVHHDYPDWTLLPLAGSGSKIEKETAVRSHQIERWRYDKVYGHDDEGPDSPVGMQWGMMIVTRQFADEALLAFPSRVVEMTEVECKDFWDNRCNAHLSDDKWDVDELQGLLTMVQLRKELGLALTQSLKDRLQAAMDPDNPMPGIRRRRDRRWEMFKADRKIRIVPKS